MDKEKLTPWIEKLTNEPDGKKRNEIVGELCKEFGVKIGDAWKALKEAGFDPKAAKTAPENGGAGGAGTDETPQADNKGTEAVTLRHKTPHKHYRRAGVVLTKEAQSYQLTPEQIATLKDDPWVEFSKEGKAE
ncbi:MAG: HI1506-related protein [Treponema sp.]|nr:HI1506-related protein [Treponema sp.]